VAIPTPVNANNSIVFMLGGGYGNGGGDEDKACIQAVLEEDATSDKVTFNTVTNVINDITVSCMVVEFYNIKSRQVLTITQDSATETTAITSVVPAKTMVSATIKSDQTSGAYSFNRFRYYLNSATELKTDSGVTSANTSVLAYVLELH